MGSTNKIRIVTAASLFDGHDAAINIMRRILQQKGAEVIHLGHNRSVHEIVECAVEEDAHAIAITSYQGGHLEFFKYMKNLLDEIQCSHIKIFGGGGGTILPSETAALHAFGIAKIYSPDDGRTMGLEGMIEHLLQTIQTSENNNFSYNDAPKNWTKQNPLGEVKDIRKIARAITLIEENRDAAEFSDVFSKNTKSVVLGISGTGGAGKSSVTDEIVRRFLTANTDKTIAVISVDPSRKKTGGALLGDRIRMNAISHPRAYMRSMATRNDNAALNKTAKEVIGICKRAGFDMIILETAGTGQSDTSIIDLCDVSIYVMTPEYGAASQLEKINMLDYADVVCINKFDKAGAQDALHDVKKQYRRNHQLWENKDEEIPVVGTIASQFNDAGVNNLFHRIIKKIQEKTGVAFHDINSFSAQKDAERKPVIPPKRIRYLSEISDAIRAYNIHVEKQSTIASQLYQLNGAMNILEKTKK
jgi:methylmalonyl-CoA mutase